MNEGKVLTVTKEIEQIYLVLSENNVDTWNEFENQPKTVKKIQTNAIVFNSEKSPQGSFLWLDSEDFNPVELTETKAITQRERLIERTMIHFEGVNYDEFPVKQVTRLIYTIA
jgi:hypothetical protein